MHFRQVLKRLAHCAALLLIATAAHTQSVQAQLAGSGSSAARDLMGSLARQFGPEHGNVTYNPTSSSAGVSAAREQTSDFGVTDVPLTAAALSQAGLRQVPVAGSAIAVVVNLPEIGASTLQLNGDILAAIYTGSISLWNHSQIASANPGVTLPARPIVPIWRADGSGSQYVFTTYLSRNNNTWRRGNGQTQNLNLAVGRSVRGGQAILDTVKATPGAIGFDALSSAARSGLKIAALSNATGRFVAPSAASVQAAMGQARWNNADLAADLDGTDGATTYPMCFVIYALAPQAPKAGHKSAVGFLQSSVARGDAQVTQSGFVALPVQAKTLVAGLK